MVLGERPNNTRRDTTNDNNLLLPPMINARNTRTNRTNDILGPQLMVNDGFFTPQRQAPRPNLPTARTEPSRRPEPVDTALFAPLNLQVPNIRRNAQGSWAEPQYNERGQEILSSRVFTPQPQEVRRPSVNVPQTDPRTLDPRHIPDMMSLYEGLGAEPAPSTSGNQRTGPPPPSSSPERAAPSPAAFVPRRAAPLPQPSAHRKHLRLVHLRVVIGYEELVVGCLVAASVLCFEKTC